MIGTKSRLLGDKLNDDQAADDMDKKDLPGPHPFDSDPRLGQSEVTKGE